DYPTLALALERALTIGLDGVPLRVIQRADLLREKIRAGSEPSRRKSKRLQDLADAVALFEESPELRDEVDEAELALLEALAGYSGCGRVAVRTSRSGHVFRLTSRSGAIDCYPSNSVDVALSPCRPDRSTGGSTNLGPAGPSSDRGGNP